MGLLTIYQPEILESKNGFRLQASFKINGKEDTLWYEVDKQYKHCLTYERADAFLVALFLLAFKNQCDIRVEAPLSERLMYTFNTYLLPLTADVRNLKPIKIFCDFAINKPLDNLEAVGTGLSCGIDSFSTICNHLTEQCPPNYKITHFTFFNAGSNGSLGGEKARRLFKKRVEMVKPCAQELGLELITVDSNISEVLELGFYETHTYRNLSASLALQKLFKTYYYSSSYSLKHFELKPNSCGHYDFFNMNMLSTEGMSFFSACPYHTRVEKTKMVSKFKLAYKYLNVCIRDGQNCGGCEKCVRTLFTLELFGKLNEFSRIFNLQNYYRERQKYIAKILARHRSDEYMQEILEEMIKMNFKIPIYSRLASKYLKVKSVV
ncbi:hypothetical protein [Heyndrickxia acidicola]|uniref:Uncharacterized protein n=1 Tax=Heyndrickxia acidicola TaxID=209389 RepID=A0ABU6MNJ7_9BACI|nr:hypothetical protein [Heyndrickxia acidicola]MED1205198.1 hypothetical protein [Heyndrickxia acidicola]